MTTDFNLNALQVINAAYSKLGVKPEEQPIEANQLQTGITYLNLLLKSMQSQGLHLWTREEGVLFLEQGKSSYLIGETGDRATTLDDFISTTLSAGISTSDTVIPLTSTAGMTAGDYIGVKLDDGTRFWTDIDSVDSSTQVTISDAVTGDSASSSSVFAYTTQINRPLRVSSFRRKTYGQDSEIEIESLSRSEYFNQVNKDSQGVPTAAYYSPLLTNGRMYVWQSPSSCDQYIRFSFQREIQDIDTELDNLDIPTEWLDTIIYALAVRLAADYPPSPDRFTMIQLTSQQLMAQSLGFDEEDESIMLYPSYD